ncbi:MAG: clostripain-related cysteine peptidase, partial [bacterium]
MKKILSLIALGMILGISADAANKEWTFLVYLDGDNNLEEAGIDDINEMEEVGSDEINIIVQFDRHPGYDKTNGNWSDCRRFYIAKDDDTQIISSPVVGTLGEVNMAETKTLTDFIQWGIENYPAKKYALVLWNHGGGWRKDIKPHKAVCWDETSGDDCLYMSEVKEALGASEKMFNLIGFDACLMGMIEVAYQIKDYCDVMVGSQETEPGDGWPYHTILADLSGTPTMNATELGKVIVERYGEEYKGWSEITQSAIDLNKLKDLIPGTLSTFADSLDSYWDEIRTAREMTDCVSSYADLFHFASLVEGIDDTSIKNNAEAVKSELNALIIANYASPDHPNFQGLNIYFPEGFWDEEYDDYVFLKPVDFPIDTTWDEFLVRFCKTTPGVPKIEPLYTVGTNTDFEVR